MEPGFYWARLKAIRIGEQPGEWRVEEIKAPREGEVQRISVLHEWGPRIDPPDAPAARPVPELPDGWAWDDEGDCGLSWKPSESNSLVVSTDGETAFLTYWYAYRGSAGINVPIAVLRALLARIDTEGAHG